jgi:cytochrome c peroxidase
VKPAAVRHALFAANLAVLVASSSPQSLSAERLPSGSADGPGCVALGRALFEERRLSGDGQTSCATCHDSRRAYSDGRRLARGVAGRHGRRNTPSLLNVGDRRRLNWDGSAASIEEQSRNALLSWTEMGSDEAAVTSVVLGTAAYREALRSSTKHTDPFAGALDCLAAFQRTLESSDSPFDAYWSQGDPNAWSASAARGFALFTGALGCSECHRIDEKRPLFSDQTPHNTGVGFQPRAQRYAYAGEGLPTPSDPEHSPGRYVTPSLRNVALTAPYMHDGSLASLSAVIAYYEGGGSGSPFQDKRIRPLTLTPADRVDLMAFLQSLTGRTAAATAHD